MNFRTVLIRTLAVLAATTASAQVPTQPVVGTPVTVQRATDAAAANGYTLTQAVAAAQAAQSAQIADAIPSRQMPQDFHLLPGDLISVRVFGQVEYSPSVVIDQYGMISLPFVGDIEVGGITILEASVLISQRLTDAGLYNHPQVSVNYIEGPGSTATLVGEMRGSIPVFTQRTLLDVLSSAGGLPPTASHVITINRPGQEQPTIVDLGADPAMSPLANTIVLPGDTIIVGRSGVVFVIGAFKSTGVFPLNGNHPTTLMELSASTGGPTIEAKYDDLRLIRTINGKRTLVKLDIKHVLYGKDPDPILMANDILFLPNSAIKTALFGGSVSSLLGIVSVALSALAFSRN